MVAAIPDRWLQYKACGRVIEGTRIICFKVPLKRKFAAAGVYHKKIFMPGRIIPPENKVIEFMNAVDRFLEQNDKSLIGVHCTHGLNRTGYMVCRYMRDRLGVPAAEAIRRFELARGYQIERENYIADLLGKTPPPPDVGCDTIIKPIENNNSKFTTPMKKDIIKHFNEKGAKKEDSRSCRVNSEAVKSDKKKIKKSTRKASERKRSDSPYDFKYDY
ncbi:RNA/RNP complex-1-interacting phosphatase isoform X2 [Battus philenor]|uniref:RNA/RNP complex-1-interacting phosphatase isoform X2 n=1 Tax=Battus philenor TaxID=42288 RepID=UPI0035CF90B6